MQTTQPANVGIPLPRRDGRQKVTGTANYTADWQIAGLAYAVPLGSTIARGKLTAIDTAAALKVPGVIDVMTHKNAPKLTEPKAMFPAGAAGSKVLPVSELEIYNEGQWVAVAIATSLEAAQQAARLIRCTYEAQAPNVELEKAKAERLKSPFVPQPVIEIGDVDAALSAAAANVDMTFHTPAENHNAIETHATTAHFHAPDADGYELTVYDATQNIHGVKDMLADQLGMDPKKVRVICKFIGGAFGGKGVAWSHTVLAANVARFVKRPVRMALAREQLYGGVGGRPESKQRIALGANAQGHLTAYIHEAVSSCGRVDTYVQDQISPSGVLYDADTRRLVNEIARLDIRNPTFMRAPAEASSMFAIESAMDALAYKLNLDPIELRRRNEPKVEPSSGKPWSSRLLLDCLDQGAKEFGWANRAAQPREQKHGRWMIGQGVSVATYPALGMATAARITLRADGSAEVACGTHEMGGGTTTTQAQHAASVLGLPVNRVNVIIGDTRLPKAPVSGGSWGTLSVGSAISIAAEKLKADLLKMAQKMPASPLAGTDAKGVMLHDGHIVLSADRTKRVALGDILAASYRDSVVADGQFAPKMGQEPAAAHSFGANFCEVAVDEQLGMVRVRRYNAVYACGRILNSQTARSQFIGGIVWGIGHCLLEHTVRDSRYGRVTNDNLAEYHIPVNADIVTPQISFIATPDDLASPIGAKGIGEIGITGVSAAIANAIFNATGKRLTRLPVLPEDVMAT